MRHHTLALILCLAVSGWVLYTTPATADDDAQALLALEAQQNDKCRGGSGDDPATQKICADRDATDAKLKSLGFCYGKNGQAGYQMQWHVCGPDSIH